MDNPGDDLPLFSYTAQQEEARREAQPGLRPDTSLSAAIQAWGEALEEQGRSIHTVKAFTGDMRLLARFVGSGTPIQQVSTHDLKNFLEWMVERRGVPCSPKTYARRVTSIKAFYRWLNDIGVLTSDPAANVPQQSVISPLPEVLTPMEVEAALEAASALRRRKPPDARPYTLLRLLLDTGIKKGECLRLHLNHVDLEAPEGPMLFVRYGQVAKRYKERKIPLSEAWVNAFHEYLRQYQPSDRLFPWSPRRLEYLLEDISELAGLEKRISFDMCRWTSALMDYRAGADRNAIRQKLGVSKIQWREVNNKLHMLAERNP